MSVEGIIHCDACLCSVMSGCAGRGVFQTYVRQILIADYVIGAGASIRWRDRSHAGESNASSRGLWWIDNNMHLCIADDIITDFVLRFVINNIIAILMNGYLSLVWKVALAARRICAQ